MIEVFIMRLSGLLNKEQFLYSEADSHHREKSLRFIRAEDRVRCLAAGYMITHYLPGYSESKFFIGVDGKPYLQDGIAFSVSHGGDYIVLSWCEGAESIGVDVEPIREMKFFRSILPYYATDEEQKAIGNDSRKAVYVWTRKESLYKCIGEGISDFRELPSTLEDSVFFGGIKYRLVSWEEDGHIFSITLRL